jgi:hypothetical protein
MQKTEFEFPDPDKQESGNEEVIKVEIEAAADEGDDNIDIEVVDDTPPKDRGRKPAEPPEEVTDEELQDYSEKVRKRLQHFSKGYHDERRAKEDALRKEEEAIRAARAIAEENRRLKELVNKNQEVLLEQAKREAAAELEAKKRSFKEAYESGDSNAVVEAQEELTAAKLKADKVNNFTFAPLQDDSSDVQPASTQVADRKAQAWQQANTWFGTDDEMTSFALGLHQKLVKQGVDPKSDEYYEKINSRMRQVFPESFESEDTPEEEEKPRRKSNVVAPATRSTAPKKIVLTATQVSIAKRLGVPLELYARQVAEDMRKQKNG